MTMMNDYLVSILVAQREHEVLAAAREAQLARVARGNRAHWWHRLTGAGARAQASDGATRPVARGRHRVAH